jgi:hypothetical protein
LFCLQCCGDVPKPFVEAGQHSGKYISRFVGKVVSVAIDFRHLIWRVYLLRATLAQVPVEFLRSGYSSLCVLRDTVDIERSVYSLEWQVQEQRLAVEVVPRDQRASFFCIYSRAHSNDYGKRNQAVDPNHTATDSGLQRNVLYALVRGSVFSVSLQSSPPASIGPQNSISVVEAVVFGCGSRRKSKPPPKHVWVK